ncbi:MAG: hypothetical protein ACFFAA_01580 [Promethearchaeota archaeon]
MQLFKDAIGLRSRKERPYGTIHYMNYNLLLIIHQFFLKNLQTVLI